ncbi:MAG: alkaline phosphatase family protein, partial [Acidimicrobiales bacterium]
MPQIDHIVIYMQENHSYDGYFGMLPVGDGYTLDGSGRPTNTNPDAQGNPVSLFRAADTCQRGKGVSQSWNATHEQYAKGAMTGFVTSSG